MKKYIETAIFSFLLILAGTSCDENYMELNKGETPLALSVDNKALTLDISNPANAAVTFTWTSGTNKGTNCAISYVFQMDVAGDNFAKCISKDMGKGIYSLQYTNEELNNILRDTFNIKDGAVGNLETRIIAIPADKSVSEQTSEAIPVTAKSYKPVSSKLYLIGDATPGGWSLDKVTEMNAISGEAGGFVWTGNMSAGNFKFVTTKTGFLPSYNKDASASGLKLTYRENDSDPDEQFRIETSGSYRIAVNIIKMTISVSAMSGPKYSKIYFVGSFTNWSFVPMRKDPVNSFIFRYGAVLNWNGGGEFKFATLDGSWDNMYHPTVANAPYTSSAVMQNDAGDNKWLIPQAECGKAYKMALNITEGAEKLTMSVFNPFETLYLVGDATPNGWSIDNATPMTKVDNYNFTWTGTLNKGEMKITCDKQGDWGGAWFMSATNDEAPTGSEQIMTFVDKKNDPSLGDVDRKWKITEAGTYTITGNQLTETITIKKQ